MGGGDLKKYQSSVCLLENPPQNSFISLQTEPEIQEKSFALNQFLKYEDVYRSSPALRSVNSLICHEDLPRQQRRNNNNNLTFSKQFSASALKFTDWGQDRSLITFNLEEGCYQENYENNSITANTIDEGEENIETEEVHDDSDSGIDSLYECIKFETTASDSFHDPDRSLVKSPQ